MHHRHLYPLLHQPPAKLNIEIHMYFVFGGAIAYIARTYFNLCKMKKVTIGHVESYRFSIENLPKIATKKMRRRLRAYNVVAGNE